MKKKENPKYAHSIIGSFENVSFLDKIRIVFVCILFLILAPMC